MIWKFRALFRMAMRGQCGIPDSAVFIAKREIFWNPDSGFEFRIAIVLRYNRDMEFISCSGLAVSGIEASAVLTPFSNRRGVRSAFLCMFWSQFLWPRASKLSLQTPQCKVLLDLLLWL